MLFFKVRYLLGLAAFGVSISINAESAKDKSYVCNLPAIPGKVYFRNSIGKHYIYNINGSMNGQRVKLFGTPEKGSIMFSRVPVQGKLVRVTILDNGAATTSLDLLDDPSVTGIYGNSAKKVAHKWGACKLISLDSPEPAVVKKRNVAPKSEPTSARVESPKIKKDSAGVVKGCLVEYDNGGNLYSWRNNCNFDLVAVTLSYVHNERYHGNFHVIPPGETMWSDATKPFRAEIVACKFPYEPARPIDDRYYNRSADQLPDCVLGDWK